MANFIITGDGRKFDLEKAQDLGLSASEGVGIKITSIHITPKRQVIVGTFSIWEWGNPGTVNGQRYHVASGDEIASLARRFASAELMALVPPTE